MAVPLMISAQVLMDALHGLGIDVAIDELSRVEINHSRITLHVWPRTETGATLVILDGPLRIDIAIDHRRDKPSEPEPAPVTETERPEFSAQQISSSFDKGTVAGAREALAKMREMLDAWIDGAQSNHAGMGHCGEGEPCWETFHVSDIKNMIKDAERELGLS